MTRDRIRQKERHTQLTRLMWRERLRRIVPVALLLLLVLGGFGVWYGDPWEQGERQGASIAHLVKPQVETWKTAVLMVRLENGAVVRLEGSENLRFEKGRRLIVQTYVSQFLGRRRYSFVAYEDAAAKDGDQP